MHYVNVVPQPVQVVRTAPPHGFPLAVTALVLSIIGLLGWPTLDFIAAGVSLVALVLSVVAARRTRHIPYSGHGIAVSALVLSVIPILMAIYLIATLTR